jgi:hypothetical protein
VSSVSSRVGSENDSTASILAHFAAENCGHSNESRSFMGRPNAVVIPYGDPPIPTAVLTISATPSNKPFLFVLSCS